MPFKNTLHCCEEKSREHVIYGLSMAALWILHSCDANVMVPLPENNASVTASLYNLPVPWSFRVPACEGVYGFMFGRFGNL